MPGHKRDMPNVLESHANSKLRLTGNKIPHKKQTETVSNSLVAYPGKVVHMETK
jgi:hypothetical protein